MSEEGGTLGEPANEGVTTEESTNGEVSAEPVTSSDEAESKSKS